MGIDAAAAWRAWSSFDGLAWSTRAFLLARMAVAPLGPMDAEVRRLHGRVLSLGCGHGAVDRYIAEINPAVQIEGIDLDQARVAQAASTQSRAPRVRVHAGDVRKFDPGDGFDAALAVDVLHHVPAEDHSSVLRSLHRALRPGGLLLIKEMATEPRRQYLWNRYHDRIVSGPQPIHCRSPAEMTDLIVEAGFEAERSRRLRRLGLYPQYLVLARKSA